MAGRYQPQRNRRYSRNPLVSFVALIVFAVAVALAYESGRQSAPDNSIGADFEIAAGDIDTVVTDTRFRRCAQPPHRNCIVDGDTFYVGSQSIRIAGIDAPELNPPQCSREYELGEEASIRLIQLLNDGPFEIRYAGGDDVDQYGRKLRTVVRDGTDIGSLLQQEGLARRWAGRHLTWCE
jgi:micrococcal nuclease